MTIPCVYRSPDFSPGDVMIAPDFLLQWVPATESIAVALVEEARAHWSKKDKQGHITWREIRAHHHPGKNDPSLPGDGFFIPIDCIKAPPGAMNNLRRFVIKVTNSVKIYQQAVLCRLAGAG